VFRHLGRGNLPAMFHSHLKSVLVAPLKLFLQATSGLGESFRRLYFHATLAAQLATKLPTSVVVLGRTWVYGTGAIRFGNAGLIYPDLHLETQGSAIITLGDDVVVSRGVHLVAMSGITIGKGTMIGEYTSIRDANHKRTEGIPLRDAGHTAKPIVLGSEVWIGRGVTILGGVTIGDGATVGANAVVTRDVPSGVVVAGVPAKAIIQNAIDVRSA
jgi:acetyltransferase-like isoleucine patch superfamily enzyme